MTTAVDTNVLLDILFPDSSHREPSRSLLAEASQLGGIVVCEVVYAELAGYFGNAPRLDGFLDATGIRREATGEDGLLAAGVAWREYTRRRRSSLICPQCGAHQDVRCGTCGRELRPRQHLIADLMIGAHALHQADRLLTRDRGFYAAYFPDLTLM